MVDKHRAEDGGREEGRAIREGAKEKEEEEGRGAGVTVCVEREKDVTVCGECGKGAKYSCPGCGRRSCSVICVKSHKAKYDCSGKRRRDVDYCPLHQFDEAKLLQDYEFLEYVRDGRDRAQYNPVRENMRSSMSRPRSKIWQAAKRRGTIIRYCPLSSAVAKSNDSFLKKQTIIWRTKIHLHAGDLSVTSTCRVSENDTVGAIFHKAVNSHLTSQGTPMLTSLLENISSWKGQRSGAGVELDGSSGSKSLTEGASDDIVQEQSIRKREGSPTNENKVKKDNLKSQVWDLFCSIPWVLYLRNRQGANQLSFGSEALTEVAWDSKLGAVLVDMTIVEYPVFHAFLPGAVPRSRLLSTFQSGTSNESQSESSESESSESESEKETRSGEERLLDVTPMAQPQPEPRGENMSADRQPSEKRRRRASPLLDIPDDTTPVISSLVSYDLSD
mmetsp:Transcript_35535/g.100082  ORF Transcript_35535/g.100082 Transcript_35535/m.100082 type:complete len:445 (+) Transcript_35535:62-1396(+)